MKATSEELSILLFLLIHVHGAHPTHHILPDLITLTY